MTLEQKLNIEASWSPGGGDSQVQIAPNGLLAAIGYYPDCCRGALCAGSVLLPSR
jgi:hypothetical protein